MLIWSTMPEEQIFHGMDSVQYNWIETEVQGVKMLIEPIAENPGCGRIVRLLCPKPASYLNPAFQPGQTVHLFQ